MNDDRMTAAKMQEHAMEEIDVDQLGEGVAAIHMLRSTLWCITAQICLRMEEATELRAESARRLHFDLEAIEMSLRRS